MEIDKRKIKQYHDEHDRIMKTIIVRFYQVFLNYFNYPFKLVNLEKDELIDSSLRKNLLDTLSKVCVNRDGYAWEKGKIINLNVEIQYNSPSDERIKGFYEYMTLTHKTNGLDVTTIVLCLEPVGNYLESYNTDLNYFNFYVNSFEYKRIRKELNIIEDKIKNNQKLNKEDIFVLMIATYGGANENQKIELASKSTKLANKIPDKDLRNLCKYLQYRAIKRQIKNKNKIKEIMESVKMNNIMYLDVLPKNEEEARQEGYKEGKEKGIKEEKEESMKKMKEVASKLLKRGNSEQEVAEITGLTLQTIMLL